MFKIFRIKSAGFIALAVFSFIAGMSSFGIESATFAHANDKTYFKNIQGKWEGSGKIVAGTYKDTDFKCKFDGSSIENNTGMKINGTCRVGVFNQKITAVIKKNGNSYKGQYLDGAKGNGLDVISGKLSNKRLVVGIKRKKLNGTMVVNSTKKNTMKITISVKTKRGLVPVIGVTLRRS